MLIKETLQLNNLKTRTATHMRISVFVICVDAIMYLLLYNLHEGNFKKAPVANQNYSKLLALNEFSEAATKGNLSKRVLQMF